MEISMMIGLISSVTVFLWMIANILVVLFSGGLARWLPQGSLKSQRLQLWLLVTLPLTLPATFLLALAFVGLAKQLGWMAQHCTATSPSLFCVQTSTHALYESTFFWLGMSLLGLVGFWVIQAWLKLARKHHKTHALLKLTHFDQRICQLDSVQPFAFVAGIRRPVIFWSKGLSQTLTKSQQRIVLAHEIHHIRHKDILKNGLFEILLAFHLAPKTLRERWLLNMETLADQKTAQRFSRLDIAEVLLKLSRTHANPIPNLAFNGASVVYRIHYLLHPQPTVYNGLVVWLLLGLLGSVLFLAVTEHHALEWLLSWMM